MTEALRKSGAAVRRSQPAVKPALDSTAHEVAAAPAPSSAEESVDVKQLNELKQQLELAAAREDMLRAQLTSLESRVSSKVSTPAMSPAGEVAGLTASITRLQMELQAKQQEMEEEREAAAARERGLQERANQLEAARGELEKKLIENVGAAGNEAEAQLVEAQMQAAANARDAAELRTRLEAMTSERDQLQSQRQELQGSSARAAAAEQEADTLRSSCEHLEQDLRSSRELVEQLTKQRQELEAERNQLTRRLAEAATAAAGAATSTSEELHEVKKDRDELQRRLAAERQQSVDQDELSSLRCEVAKAKQDLIEERVQMQTAQDLERKALRSVKEEASRAQLRCETLQVEVDSLRKQLEVARNDRRSRVTGLLERSRAAMSDMQQQHQQQSARPPLVTSPMTTAAPAASEQFVRGVQGLFGDDSDGVAARAEAISSTVSAARLFTDDSDGVTIAAAAERSAAAVAAPPLAAPPAAAAAAVLPPQQQSPALAAAAATKDVSAFFSDDSDPVPVASADVAQQSTVSGCGHAADLFSDDSPAPHCNSSFDATAEWFTSEAQTTIAVAPTVASQQTDVRCPSKEPEHYDIGDARDPTHAITSGGQKGATAADLFGDDASPNDDSWCTNANPVPRAQEATASDVFGGAGGHTGVGTASDLFGGEEVPTDPFNAAAPSHPFSQDASASSATTTAVQALAAPPTTSDPFSADPGVFGVRPSASDPFGAEVNPVQPPAAPPVRSDPFSADAGPSASDPFGAGATEFQAPAAHQTSTDPFSVDPAVSSVRPPASDPFGTGATQVNASDLPPASTGPFSADPDVFGTKPTSDIFGSEGADASGLFGDDSPLEKQATGSVTTAAQVFGGPPKDGEDTASAFGASADAPSHAQFSDGHAFQAQAEASDLFDNGPNSSTAAGLFGDSGGDDFFGGSAPTTAPPPAMIPASAGFLDGACSGVAAPFGGGSVEHPMQAAAPSAAIFDGWDDDVTGPAGTSSTATANDVSSLF
jgi:hypothetical protein